MDQPAYEAYVEKAQAFAERNFSAYKFRVAAFALLGYAVIVAILVVLLGLTGGLVALAFSSTALFLLLLKNKIWLLLIPVMWVLARSLWVRVDKPTGYVLERDRFPILFEELDSLREELDSLPVHEVLLTPELNAAVVQTPRLGILGWQRNTLILGLELLLTMSPDQARSVVAHELGHLSGNHSRFHGWIYRVRMSWYRIRESVGNDNSFGSRVLNRFFDWYAPRFSAYSFPLARFNEYEADAVSAELTSAEAVGRALVNAGVTAPFVDEHYWQEYFRAADRLEQPEHLPWRGLGDFLGRSADSDLETRLQAALTVDTNYADTHPSLRDRLAALGVEAVVDKPVSANAATAWFGDRYDAVIADFDQEWKEHNAEHWRSRYLHVQQSKQQLADLEQQPPESLSDEDLWAFASLSHEFGSRESATAALRLFQERHPDDAQCAYHLGLHLCDKQDADCLAEFEKALANPAVACEAAWSAYDFATRTKDERAAAFWLEKAEEAGKQRQEAYREREHLSPRDRLVEPDLNDEALKRTLEQLRASKHVGKIWVARKITKYRQDIPAYAIAVTFKGMALTEDSALKKIGETIDPFDGWIVPKTGDFKPLAKRVIKHGKRVA